MDLFNTILSPFVFIIKQLFMFSYGVTGNYGSAIVLLSFSISLLLLPIFILIEKAKKKDDIVKNKMQPLVDEIKSVYKGQERYYYIKTLNRQHKYSPFKALIPILSLLIQIPFFIAAYQYLEHLESLKGVSYGFISDLSLADGLLGGVNILPIAMTLVNLITAYFYTRYGSKTELRQMFIVALVFLVMLYKLPASLLIYWTMNNVFSFMRLLITNPEVFKKSETVIPKKKTYSFGIKAQLVSIYPKVKTAFFVLSTILILSQLIWALKYNFDDIVLRVIAVTLASIFIAVLFGFILLFVDYYKSKAKQIVIKPVYFFSLLFLSFYFYLASQFYYSSISLSLNIKALIFLIPSQILGVMLLNRNKNSINSVFFKIVRFILIVLISIQAISIYAYFSANEVSISILNAHILVQNSSLFDVVLAGVIFSLIIAITLFVYAEYTFKKTKKHIVIYGLSILFVLGLIFLWNPLMVFSTSPESFSFSAFDILKENFQLFITSLVTGIVLYLIAPSKLKKVLLIISLFLFIVSIINSFIIPIKLGTLQMHRFSDIDNILKSNSYYILESAILLGIIIGIDFLIRKAYLKQMVFVLIIFNLVLISQSLFVSYTSGHFFNNEFVNSSNSSDTKDEIGTDADDVSSKSQNKKSISFSKSKKNVVVIVADMFQGWYLRTMLEQDKNIENELDGFKWYPNTISITNYTSSSAPSILMGYDYTPDKLDLDSTLELREKISIVNLKLIEKVKSKGFNITSTRIPYSSIDNNDYGVDIPLWSDDWGYLMPVLNIGNAIDQEYTLLWQNALFFSSPLFIKPEIYRNGSWHFKSFEKNENSKLTQHYNFLRALPYISDNKSENPNYIYIWTNASHFPWDLVDDEGVFHPDVKPYENNKWVMEKIVNWIKWMKANDVYDNTRIIILSDHGIRDIKVDGNVMITNPFIPKESDKISVKQLLCFTPLMMVKDYNATGKISEDWRFLSNVDAAAISLSENDPTKIEPPLDRTLTAFYVSWRIKADSKKLPIVNSYKVSKNVYEVKNWIKTK